MKHIIKIEREFDLSDTHDLDKFKRYQEDTDLKQEVLELLQEAMGALDKDFTEAKKNYLGAPSYHEGHVANAFQDAFKSAFDILKHLRATVRAL